MNTILTEFGFSSTKSLLESLLAPQYKYMLISISTLASIGESFFGLSNVSLILLVILIILELITGLWASKVRGRKIVSKRFQRFGLKFMIYFFFIIVFHRLKEEPSLESTSWIYKYMHSFFIMYFVGVHLKSIAENYGRITGKKSEFGGFIKKVNEKFFNLKK